MSDMSSFTETVSAPASETPRTSPVSESIPESKGTEIGVGGVTPPVEPPKETKESVDARRWAALSKRERALNQQREEIAKEKADVLERNKKFEAWQKQQEEEDRTWQTKPLDVIKKKGWDYSKLTNLVLNEEKPTPEMVAAMTVDEKLAEFKRQQDADKAAALEAQRKDAEARLEQSKTEYKASIVEFAKENADSYKFLNLYGQHELAAAITEQHFIKTKRVLSLKESCDLAENYIRSEWKKAEAFEKASTPAPSPDGKTANQNQTQKKSPETVIKTENQPRSLNNSMTQSAASIPRPLSREERIKRAMAISVP